MSAMYWKYWGSGSADFFAKIIDQKLDFYFTENIEDLGLGVMVPLWKSTNFFGVRIHNTDQQCYEFWVNDVIPSSICVAQNDEKSVIDTPNLLVDQPKTTAVYS